MLNFKKFEYRLPDSPSQGVSDSPTRRVGELATPRLAESGSRRLSDSPSFSFEHSKADSPTRRVGESSTPRLSESYSQRLLDSPSCRVADSPTRRVGDSFFDYEYLCEFETKSGTARKVVWGMYEDPISAKTPEIPPHCHVPLRNRSQIWIFFFFLKVLKIKTILFVWALMVFTIFGCLLVKKIKNIVSAYLC